MNLSGLKRLINNYWILLLLVAVKFTLQIILVNPVYELHRDEFLHLDQANHLALGFISVPPFTSLISKIIFFLGGSLFWIRFFPALFGALTIVFTWLITESLGGSLYARLLAGCAVLFSVLVRLNILFQPNSFDILTWTIIFYLIVKFVQSEKSKWLFFCSVIAAIGFYNKYNLVFLITGLMAGFLLTPQRKVFLNPSLWKAVLLAFLLILPNIIWQFVHHFPVIQHMKALKETQLDNNSSLGFLKGQFLFFFGSIPLIFAVLIAFIQYRPFRIFRIIGITFLTVLVLFSFLKAKEYYAIGLYPVLFAFGSVYIEQILSRKGRLIVVPALIGFNLLFFVASAKLVYPVMSPAEINESKADFDQLGMLRWEDGKNHDLPQDFADMIGWREMAEKSLIAYQAIPPEELKNTLIFCDNYGQTGALNYYNRGKMPEAYSFNTDYIYWLPQLDRIQNILIIGKKPSPEIISMFAGFERVGVVENRYAREKNTAIYLLTGASPEVTNMFYKMAEERKDKFDIF